MVPKDEKKEGRAICVEMIQQIKDIKYCSGVHIMAYKQEQHVVQIIKDSKILGDRKP